MNQSDLDFEPSNRPLWRRTPCLSQPRATKLKGRELADKLNNYFSTQYDKSQSPTLCDMAGQTGFDSVTQMVNHARRKGGKTMRAISQGVLAVAAEYEEQAQAGNKNALQLLSLMPQFDSIEPADQKPERPFQAQREINLQISGVTRLENKGADLSPQEAYLQLIKNKTYEEIAVPLLEAEPDKNGDFAVMDLEDPTTDESNQ